MGRTYVPPVRKAISIRFTESVWERARAAARSENRSLTSWVEQVVADRLAAAEDRAERGSGG